MIVITMNMTGSGKTTALSPHLDALARTVAQMNENQEYIQYPDKDNGLLFEQPFIVSNVRLLYEV